MNRNVKYAAYPPGALDDDMAINHVVYLYTAIQQHYPFVPCYNEAMELEAMGFINTSGIQHLLYQVTEFLRADSLPIERSRRSTIN